MGLRLLKWLAIALGGLVALMLLIVLGLDTAPGRRFVADRLAGVETASGIRVRVGRIDGSLYGRMVLRDLRVEDQRGAFLTSPELVVDWRPFAYLRSKIDVRALTAANVVFLRNPALKPTPPEPNAPLLPDIDLSVGRLQIDRLDVLPPVTGQRHVVRLAGSATIADRRAQIVADAGALKAAGLAGGDRLHVALDAVPDANRFALDARLRAPKGGLVDSYAKLGRPLDLMLTGRGDWAAWQGGLTGRLGGERLAGLAVTGTNGTFRTTGRIRPGLVLTGPAARLADPAIALDLTTVFDKRTIDTRLTARSAALALDAAGKLDLARNGFGGFRLNARLLTPGAIAPNVRGRDVALTATLDGPFATPTIDYRLTAASLGFGTTGIEGLAAGGKAVIDAKRIRVPLHATARAVTGLDAAAGGLLTNLRVDGDVAYENGKVATDNLRLRSDRIDATAIVLADLAKGTYTGALKGRINDYAVQGLGRVSLVTDARLVPGRNGAFAVAGHVRLVTRRLDNASVRDQLGGNAVVDADVSYDLAGGALVKNLRVRAPKLQLAGSGFYRPDGRIGFHATGRSAAYGPLALDVSGTVARPVARLRAASPGVGAGLKDVEATLTSGAAGYRVQGKGNSDYGPFAADVTVRAGRGPLAIDIASATFAGVRIGGMVTQAAAGPFAGTLTLAGQGLNGAVRLAAAGAVQRADLDLRAANAQLPGPVPMTLGQGTLTASLLLTPGAPSITGRFALGNLKQGDLLVTRAQGRIAYDHGRGQIALIAAGASGVPFDLAAQAALEPTRITANLSGHVNGVALRLAQPAIATKAGGTWTLAPATIVLPQGQAVVNGRFGGGATSVHALLQRLDLAIVEAFRPGLGIGGTATGTVDYVGAGTVPQVRARLDVAGFTRTASLTVSDPVDIALLATLGEAGADARALVRRQGTTVGRLQARLAPLGPGASLSQRLFAAPLSGGIRYNGPAEVLWTLAGVPKQELTGPLAIGADFGGRLDAPTVTGIVRASALRYENETYGTVLSDMAIDGRFTQSRFELARLAAKAGGGTVQASGTVGLDAAGGFPIDLTATLANARLARGDDVDATVSGKIAVTNSTANGGLIAGDLTIPEMRYQIVRQGAAAVPELTGVRRKGVPPPKPAEGSLPSYWKLDIHVRADNQIFVSGMGLEAEWKTDMRVTGTSAAPVVTGKLQVVRGTYSFAGRRFELDRGIVTFQGGLTNPALDISASTTVEGVSATINITGYAQAPQIGFTSTPALPQDEVLSRLLFGSSVTSLSPTQALQLAAALNSLRSPGGGGGFNPLGKLRSATGIDRLRVLGADQSAGRGTSLAAGKYISNNIYVEIVTDARGFTATQIEISLSKVLSLLSQAGSFGGSNVALRYKKDY